MLIFQSLSNRNDINRFIFFVMIYKNIPKKFMSRKVEIIFFYSPKNTLTYIGSRIHGHKRQYTFFWS